MNFNVSNIHTISNTDNLPSSIKESKVLSESVDSGNNVRKMTKFSPITEQVFKAMKESASDPANLRITVMRKNNLSSSDSPLDENCAIYIEASEFNNFLEATGFDIDEAVNSILEHYSEEIPDVGIAGFHVVFPNDAEKNYLGCDHFGEAVKDDWCMKLISGCRRYGIRLNSGVESVNP